MCTKSMAASESFLGLKIVPQIIQELNVKSKTVSRSRKDISKEDVAPTRLQQSSGTCAPSPSRQIRRLRPTTSLPPEREAGVEILEILLSKASSESLTSHYIGSPPHRAGNPLIRDAHFCQKRASPSPSAIPRNSSSLYRGNICAKNSPSSTSRGAKAFTRVEGFITSNGESHQGIPSFA
ncbi:hypothetical protein L7F22_058905 [Adiantum nelumboides]|nr:hypothetical protein [Adiantum nelumboides]